MVYSDNKEAIHENGRIVGHKY